MRYNIAKILLITCILLFVFIVPIINFLGIDIETIKKQHPGFPFFLNGICLIFVGFLGLIFRDEFGRLNANFRKNLAEKFPMWKKMSGLPDEQLEYYFSVKFNKKMTIIGAVILIITGSVLLVIGSFF